MSDFPCTSCRNTHGSNQYFYVNWYDDRELVKRRLRLCRDCVMEFFAFLEYADVRDASGHWAFCEKVAI